MGMTNLSQKRANRNLNMLDMHANCSVPNIQSSMGLDKFNLNWILHKLEGCQLTCPPCMKSRKDTDDFQTKLLCNLTFNNESLLARLSPKKSAPDYPLYEQFSHSMMDWALDAVQRHQLITAIYIYVYQNRKGGDTDGRME